MMRHAAALAIALCLSPTYLFAQTSRLTVTVPSADIHKFPSVGSPVIAHAPRGTVLEIRRTLGSWMTVAWPAGENGVAYMHVSTGSVAAGSPPATNAASSTAPARPSTARAEAATGQRVASGSSAQTSARRPAAARPVYVTPATHLLGVGMQVGGSRIGVGASMRAWSDRAGLQLTLSHSELASVVNAERLTSTQIEPSALYALPDHVGDFVWVRPYVGSGVHFGRRTWKREAGYVGSPVESGFGFQAFGGGEFAFSGMSRFALSADLGRRWSRRPVAGFELGGWNVAVSGHWYVK